MPDDLGRVPEGTGPAVLSDPSRDASRPDGASPSRILFRCPKCRKKQMVDRDDTDPPAARLASMVCPDCDDGDFNSPDYFDVGGKWINPVEHLA